MKAVIQRVSESSVTVDGKVTGVIGKGLLVLLGVGTDDTSKDADFLVNKIVNLRIFEDENKKMNLSLVDIGGEMLVVSQFTLLGDCHKGRRPSFIKAARPETASELYEYFVEKSKAQGIKVETGIFQAMMDVSLINDGPVTLIVESNNTSK
ncbi:MAG: D-tyrosyl-tRNA(Tyr) deacylase [Desulfobacterales bacterium]|nr:D-tyrosyl-tRNA(Tyr) deacylase [Desulfobacterales bacterium]